MEFHKDVWVKKITKEEGNSFSITTVEGETVTASYKFHSAQGERLRERLLGLLEKHIDEFMSNEFHTSTLTLFYDVDTQIYKFSNFMVFTKTI